MKPTALMIGIIGDTKAGKHLFVELCSRLAVGKKVLVLNTSQFLADRLVEMGMPATRENRQKLAIEMVEKNGPDALTKELAAVYTKSEADVFFYDSVRWEADFDFVRSCQNNIIVYVTASLDVRYERARLTSDKPGERGITREEFDRLMKYATETKIRELGQKADVVIENNGTKQEFATKAEDFFNNKVKPFMI